VIAAADGVFCLAVGAFFLIVTWFGMYTFGYERGRESALRDEKQRGFPVLPPSDQDRIVSSEPGHGKAK
jgi:hypothetical protein